MEGYEYIQILSTIIWVTVPFRKLKSKHFIFFLFLGFNDLSSFLVWNLFSIQSKTFWVPIYYLAAFSIDKEFFKRELKLILLGFLGILIANFYLTAATQDTVLLHIDIAILIVFARYLYWGYLKSEKISLFYIVMTIYCLLSVSKSILMVNDIYLGLDAFYVDTILQMIIGLYLIFVKRDFQFSLKIL